MELEILKAEEEEEKLSTQFKTEPPVEIFFEPENSSRYKDEEMSQVKANRPEKYSNEFKFEAAQRVQNPLSVCGNNLSRNSELKVHMDGVQEKENSNVPRTRKINVKSFKEEVTDDHSYARTYNPYKELSSATPETDLGLDRNNVETENIGGFLPANREVLDQNALVDNKEEVKEEIDETNFVEEVQLLEAEELNDVLNQENVEMKKEYKNIEIYKETDQYVPENNDIEVGQTYASKEDVLNKVQLFSDSNFSPLVLHSSSANRKARLSYKCPYGLFKKSTSTGKRKMKQNRYVGCPVIVNFCQRVNGMFVVTKAELEHKGHDVGEEEYFAKRKKKLTEDEKGAVKAFLETKPSNQEVSLLLTDLTGRKYSTRQARDIVKRL
eukprot:GFUD01021905.1.p1 GENE.GFUD01021905.1~~GFUD01021905.1.p1  ORF type:complete len:382 (+),score=115.51 GFUD01021905.1:56-1201(+)